MLHPVFVALALASLPQDPAPRIEKLDALALTLTIPPQITRIEVDSASKEDEDDLGDWIGHLGEKTVWFGITRTEDGPDAEPSDITWRMHDFVRSEDYDGDPFEFAEHKLVPGNFGSVPYASLLHGTVREKGTTKEVGYSIFLAGLAESRGYLVDVIVEPAPSPEEKKLLLDFATKGIAYAGAKRDPKWSDDAAKQRWKESVPGADEKKSLKLDKIIRTEHYLVLTNSSGGDAFAKQMEANYATIQKVYPFAEIPGRKLMPVFLFQTPDEYYAFYAKTFETTVEEASESKGVAWRDFYATWYEAPKDPVHIHEATHQIFGNRLELQGAGSWFQEGVAEYIETKPNDRNEIARRVKDGKHTSLRELMRLESLLGSSEDDVSGDSAAALHYKEAALLIEFLRDSKFGKDKFLEWLHATGNVEDNDLVRIELALRKVYGVTIDELDKKLQEYCKKR
jgi:hypothetical protein